MAEPPNPPPVMRGADGSVGLRGFDGEVELRHGDLEVVAHGGVRGIQQVTDRKRTLLAQRAHGVEHALVLGDDVAHAAERHVVEHRAGAIEVVDGQVAQRRHAHELRAEFAGCPSLAIPAGGMFVLHLRVDEEQFEAGLGEPERDDLRIERAAVEEHGVVGLAEQRRGLVHDAGRSADDLVLGEATDAGERRAVEPEPPHVVERDRDRTLDRRG